MFRQLHKLQEEPVWDAETVCESFCTLSSYVVSTLFIVSWSIVDHGAWEKSDRGWTCRVRLTRGTIAIPRYFLPRPSSCISSTSKTRESKVLARRRFWWLRTQPELKTSASLRRPNWSCDAMRSTDVLCRCSKCCVPRTALALPWWELGVCWVSAHSG